MDVSCAQDVVTLSSDTILDHAVVDAMCVRLYVTIPAPDYNAFSLANGYSRIPIHEPNDPLSFRGFLLVKKVAPFVPDRMVFDLAIQLLAYDPSKALPVSHFKLSILPEAHPSINCFQALDYLYATPFAPNPDLI